MGAAAWLLLVTNALVWSSSFLFIKVAVVGVDAPTLTFVRTLLGALVLWAAASASATPAILPPASGSTAAPRTRYTPVERRALAVNAALTAIPFTLVAWAETGIDSGLAGILNATTPLWAGLLALRYEQEHSGNGRRLAGAATGFAGVVLLLGSQVKGSSSIAAMLAVLVAAACYGLSAIVVRRALPAVDPTRTAAWSCTLSAAVTLVPAALLQGTMIPPTGVLVSLAVLGLVATGLGLYLYYRLLAMVGAARASMVTYLMPPLAVTYGAVLLDEPVSPRAVLAMLVILGGVWIGSRSAASGVERAQSGDAVERPREGAVLEPAEPAVDRQDGP